MAFEAFSPYGKPIAVVINRAGLGDNRVYEFCTAQNLPILAEIPYRRDIAEHYSKGMILAEIDEGLGELFAKLGQDLRRMAKEARNA